MIEPTQILHEGRDFSTQQELTGAQARRHTPSSEPTSGASPHPPPRSSGDPCSRMGPPPGSATYGLTSTASPHPPSRSSGFQPESTNGGLTSGAVMRLVQTTLRGVQMHQRTGDLPGGLPYSRLPAWQVELYRTWWQES